MQPRSALSSLCNRVPSPGTLASRRNRAWQVSVSVRVLGAVGSVDGAAVPVGGPATGAACAALPREPRCLARPADSRAFFAEQSVNSADHALRNHVTRLRKALATAAEDEPRLVARAPRHLLRVGRAESDLEQFERLVTNGREHCRGRRESGATSFRGGGPGREPAGRSRTDPFVRVKRIGSTSCACSRRGSCRRKAGLGGHLALVPELDALSTEHPYRERFGPSSCSPCTGLVVRRRADVYRRPAPPTTRLG
jgi:hypothetical protein